MEQATDGVPQLLCSPAVMSPPSDLERLEAIHRHAHESLRCYATAYLNEGEENRNLIREAGVLDDRSMLARSSKIVDRYLEDAKRDPWKPPQGKPRPTPHSDD